MLSKNFNIYKCLCYTFSIIGTIIGAGFVSGKEISTFLGIYGNLAYIIALLIGVIYFFCLKLFFSQAEIKHIEKPLSITITITQFISLTAMIAGLYSVSYDYFGSRIIFYVSIILCFIIILFGLKGITNANIVLIPFLVLFIVYVGYLGIVSNKTIQIETHVSSLTKTIFYFFVYCGLDLFGCYPMCVVIGKNLNKKEQNLVSLFVSFILSFLIACYLFSVLSKNQNYSYFDLPLLNFVADNRPSLYIIACLIICIGIVTTLLSNGFILMQNSFNASKNYGFVLFLSLFCSSFVLSFVGFSKIIEYLYPIIGVIGIILVVYLFCREKFKDIKKL